MITTSNSVTHNITVTALNKTGQVDSNLDVVNQVIVNINISIGFAKTSDGGPGIGTTTIQVTERCSGDIISNLNTSGISTFVGFSSLTESKVLSWISSSDLSNKKTENENILLERRDKVWNPLKYQKTTVSVPWS